MENNLLPCPFCGKTESLQCLTEDELMGDQLLYASDFYCIFCNASRGGCGTVGGLEKTKQEAIKAWNRRASNGMD